MCECPVEKSMRACENIYGPDRAYKCERALVKAFFKCQKLITHRRGWAYAAYERFARGTSAGKAIDTKSWPQFVQIALSPSCQCRAKSADKMLSCLCMSRIRPAAHLPPSPSPSPLLSSSLSWSLSFCADSRPLLSFQAYLARH